MDSLNGESIQFFKGGEIKFRSSFEKNQLIAFEEFDVNGDLIDWKMIFSISQWADKDGMNLLFTVENQKFDLTKVDLKLYAGEPKNENFITDFSKSEFGNELKVTINYFENDKGLFLVGRIFDMEVLSDSTGIVKNYEDFEKLLKPDQNSLSL